MPKLHARRISRATERRALRRTAFAAAVALFAVALPAAAQKKPPPQQSSLAASMPSLETWELDNGLQVAFMPMTKAPVVTVQVWYHAGSKDEHPDKKGSAHMFEHMMFKGTAHVRPEEHARHIDRLGGSVNAFTTEDTTAYHNTLPKEYLDFAIQLEAERMRNLMFRDEMIAGEKEVVKEEIRLRITNSPIAKGVLAMFDLAYTVHPYAWTASGTIDGLDATTRDDLERFYNQYYVPNNALLVVVGDVTADEVKASAAKWFGEIDKGAEPPRPAAQKTEPPQKEMRRATSDPAQIGLVAIGYHVPAARHDDMYALQIAGLILSGGESSRLYRRLVRTDKIAVAAQGQFRAMEEPGLYVAFGAFLPPNDPKTVEVALMEEIARLAKSPPTQRELQKAKNQLTSSFVFGLEGVQGLAQQIGFSWIQTGDAKAFLADMDKYQSVTRADVQRVVKTYLVPTNATVMTVSPQGEEGGAK